jgi:hypothetical protein
MKTKYILLLTLSWLGLVKTVSGQTALNQTQRQDVSQGNDWVASEPQIVERGQDHRIWQWTVTIPRPGKTSQVQTRHVTELSSGMHYRDTQGQWVETQPVFKPAPGGAVMHTGPHKVALAGNINTEGAIQVGLPNGKVLQMHVLGLGYVTPEGKVVPFATVRESQGVLIGPDQALYRDCFAIEVGGIKVPLHVDLRLTCFAAGFEQDVLVREQLPDPASLQLPEDSKLCVMTEFLNLQAPTKIERALPQKDRQKPAIIDEDLEFGGFRMGRGKAFDLGEGPNGGGAVVTKQLLRVDNRDILVEAVKYKLIEAMMKRLPGPDGAALPKFNDKIKNLALPKAPIKRDNQPPMEIAQIPLKGPALVLDYRLLNSSLTNYLFKAEETYLVSGAVNLYGTTVIEPGTVIKYTNSPAAKLAIQETLNPRGEPYRPIVFTSMHDNSLGETIPGSSGTPSNLNGATYLEVASFYSDPLSHMRFTYAGIAIRGEGAWVDLWHSQIRNCRVAADVSTPEEYGCIMLENALISNCSTGFIGGWQLYGAQVTMDNCGVLLTSANPDMYAWFANSIFTATPQAQGYIQTNSWWATSYYTNNASDVFQAVGGAGYYLKENSPLRGLGSAGLEAKLARDLKSLTTWPPVVYSNATLTVSNYFPPVAMRDTQTNTDLGYHYYPMDYVFGGTYAQENINFAPGTVVGWFRTSSGWYHDGHSIRMADSKTVKFDGTVDNPCWWVRCNTVQEQGYGLWEGGYGPGGISAWSGSMSVAPTVQLNFTKCAAFNSDMSYFRDDWGHLKVKATHSEFLGNCLGGYYMDYALTNCLFDRCSLALVAGGNDFGMTLRNCTFRGKDLYIAQAENGYSYTTIRDCSFDGVAMNVNYISGYYDFDYNAFLTSTQQLSAVTTNYLLTNFNWQVGPLGRFYLPTNSVLINHGSVNATNRGLYHFCTTSNQVKEANSTVDVGYHPLAVGTDNLALDYDSDGIPDYLEDIDGNGVVSSIETDWQTCDTDGDGLSDGYELYVSHTPANSPQPVPSLGNHSCNKCPVVN